MDDLFGAFEQLWKLNLPRTRLLNPFDGLLGAFYTKLVTMAHEDSKWFVEHSRPEPARVLDLCCGGGRSVVEFARAGWRVTGVDLSETQLASASRLAANEGHELVRRISLLKADVTSLALGETFDAVVIGGLSFTLFNEKQRVALYRTVREHLTPGGRLLFDFTPRLDGDRVSEHMLTYPIRLGERSGFVLVGARREPGMNGQFTNMYAELVDHSGHTIRYLTGFRFWLDDPEELTVQLAAHGLVVRARERHQGMGGYVPFMAREFIEAELVS